MQRKLALAFFLAAAALVVCTIRVYVIVRGKGDDYSKIVLSQQNYSNTLLPFRRGTIMDRNRTILAASEEVYNVILDCSILNSLDEVDLVNTKTALKETLGYSPEDIQRIMDENNGSTYLRYERRISSTRKEAFEEYRKEFNENKGNKGGVSNKGVWFETDYKRVYPYESLACTVLGFSGSDSSKGNFGVEQYYNDYLVGVDGRSYGYQTADGIVSRTTKAPTDGNTVITTLDYTIQSKTETALRDFCIRVEADNVGVLVMNPTNGEILAMASNSFYDLNNPADMSAYYTDAELIAMSTQQTNDALQKMWRNFMVTDTFEPGSTAKVFTEAAALEEGMASASSIYHCDGGEQLAKDTYVRCSHYHDDVNFVEALAYSCNDAMMQMSTLMGKKIFCKYQDLFGLGKLTGIDLPSESAGMLYSEDRMQPVDLGTNSFGQNYTVTMVQMAAAYASILNGGYYYQPHVVKEILSSDGEVIKEVGTTLVRETVSETTSRLIRSGLEMCVEGDSGYCTGKAARIQGYTVGGKTGTAEKYPRGNDEYLLSFVGFTTVENPQVLVYVIVDNPHDHTNNSARVAVELEQTVMSSILDYMHITAIDSRAWEQAKQQAAEEASRAAEAAANAQQATDAEGNPIPPETDAEGNVIPAETPATQEGAVSDEGEDSDEEIPEGGILEGDDGPPEVRQTTTAAEAEGEEADEGESQKKEE